MSKQDVPSFTEQAVAQSRGQAPAVKVMEPAPVVPQVLQKLPDPSPEAPPPNLFSGVSRRLEVFGKPGSDPKEPIKGYELYWFPDKDGGLMISQALASGWRFVDKEEIALNDAPTSPGNDDIGANVRRWTGPGVDGKPVHDYLMKIPKWLYEQHMLERERIHQQQEDQLAMGTYKVDDLAHTYNASRAPAVAPSVRSSLPTTKIGRYYKPPQT